MNVEGVAIVPRKEVKYLEIYFDTRGIFGVHKKYTIKKAERRVAMLARILPNVRGPSIPKRRVLLEMVHSTLLYGASIWSEVLRSNRYVVMLRTLQRKMLLRVACGYHTVSAATLQVITGILPISLLVEERKELAESPEQRTPANRKRIRDRLVDKWQEEWYAKREAAGWTREIIPNIKTWLECGHRILTYEMTQILTGHGYFKEYTHRIGKEDASTCVYYCEDFIDLSEHTLMVCGRWRQERERLNASIEGVRSMEELVARMVEDVKVWREVPHSSK